jgi:anti-sigma regulatory factor (Ser/Thr protein kinase)
LDIYFKKRRWKRLLLIVAILIGIGSLFYTNRLVRKMSEEEKQKAKAWGEATRILAGSGNESDYEMFSPSNLSESEERYLNDVLTYLHEIITSNETIPIIIEDGNGNIVSERNLGNISDKKLKRELQRMKQKVTPIEIVISDDYKNYLYYKESSLLAALRYYPIFQLVVIVIFIGISYLAFSSARKAEQNLVWIGMAKETAHQLGTPISSLMAWVELLKDEDISPSILEELTKDTERLQEIAERFSKVGSNPELKIENLYEVLYEAVGYLKKRVSKRIEFTMNFSKTDVLFLPLSAPLFGWVIENLVRNSVDAMEKGEGTITITVTEKSNDVEIDVADNGRGISKSKSKTIFRPGFTTKKRGWGLGLSLSRRIIEIYHRGKIFLKYSEPNVNTVFRIVLRKNLNN